MVRKDIKIFKLSMFLKNTLTNLIHLVNILTFKLIPLLKEFSISINQFLKKLDHFLNVFMISPLHCF